MNVWKREKGPTLSCHFPAWYPLMSFPTQRIKSKFHTLVPAITFPRGYIPPLSGSHPLLHTLLHTEPWRLPTPLLDHFLLTHSFIEHLLCARRCVRHEKCSREQDWPSSQSLQSSRKGRQSNNPQIKSYVCLWNMPPVYCKLLKGKY